jgi:DNA-binding transcriptional LysR family regulator
MSNLRNLESFVAVAQLGTVAAAASRVALTPAAVSLQVKALEAELRRELFHRGGHSLVLNAAGRELLPLAMRMLKLYDQMRSAGTGRFTAVAAEIAGLYRVGTIVSAVAQLSSVVVELKKSHPRLEVHLTVERSIRLASLCAEGGLDAAVAVGGDKGVAHGVSWTPLYAEPLVIVAPASVSGRSPTKLLSEYPFLCFDRHQLTGALVQRALRHYRANVTQFLELNSIEALVELVRQGVGVSLLPHLRRARWDNDPDLRVLPLPGLPLQRDVGLLQRRDRSEVLAQAIVKQFLITQ